MPITVDAPLDPYAPLQPDPPGGIVDVPLGYDPITGNFYGLGGSGGGVPLPARVEKLIVERLRQFIQPPPPLNVRAAECRGVVNIYGYSSSAKELEELIVSWTSSVGVAVDVTSRVRSCDEQSALYRAGRTTARPTTSQHEFGFAFDLVPRGGFQRYGATFAQAVKWLVALAEYWDGHGLAEADHAHITVYSNTAWRAWITARDIGWSVPYPGRRPPSPQPTG